MKTLQCSLLAVVAMLFVSLAATDASANLQQAAAQAKQSGKPILVVVTGDG
ncbi:MAG: hypothetical protein WEA31_03650 [Pirellulales bacterium]